MQENHDTDFNARNYAILSQTQYEIDNENMTTCGKFTHTAEDAKQSPRHDRVRSRENLISEINAFERRRYAGIAIAEVLSAITGLSLGLGGPGSPISLGALGGAIFAVAVTIDATNELNERTALLNETHKRQ